MVRTHPVISTHPLISTHLLVSTHCPGTAGRRSCRTDRTRSTRSRTSARRRSTSFACRTSRAREAAASRACAAYCLSFALAAVRARPPCHALPLATRKAPARSRERDARRRTLGRVRRRQRSLRCSARGRCSVLCEGGQRSGRVPSGTARCSCPPSTRMQSGA
jgi:hypothetical protein